MAGTIHRQGKPRPGGQRAWRVTAYAPDNQFPYGRVRFKLETGDWSQRSPRPDQTLDECFGEVEAAITDSVLLAVKGVPTRDVAALCDRYEAWMVAAGRADTTITKNINILSKWVRPFIGDIAVADWSPEHTRVIRTAVAHLSPGRIEDVGTILSGLRRRAQEKSSGARWLPLTENPMEGVSFTRTSTVAGQSGKYIPPSKRPSDKQVAAVIEAARLRGDIIGVPTLPLLVGIAAKTGVRQGENFALRGIDVDSTKLQLNVDGAWCQPRGHNGKKPYRKSTKNGIVRTTPFPPSLKVALVERVAELRANNDDAGWLVPDTRTGEPWNKETFNDEWHRIVALTADLAAEDPDHYETWPRVIPFRNLRHYCATRWHSLGFRWEDVALYLGHSVETCLAYYVRAADDVDEKTRRLLEND